MRYSSPVLYDQKALHLALETLSAKEKVYVDLRLQGALPNAAARAAGLEPASERAEKLERDPRILAAMEYTVKVQAHRVRLTRDDVVAGLLEATRMAATATELVAAWREIGKIIGAYEPLKIDISTGSRTQLEALPDEELARLAAIEGEFEVLDFDDSYTPDTEQ